MSERDWVLVPREPTDGQVAEAIRVTGDQADFALIYDAMLAAAPQPPAEAQAQAIGPEWSACRKRPVVVHVREQRADEQHVSTREGITPVKPDDLIMRGVEGEEYPIGRDLFNKTYDLVDEAQAQGGGEVVYQIENDPDDWVDVDQAIYEGHDGSRKRILYTAPPSAPVGVEGLVERMRQAPSRLWMADLVGQKISVERMRDILAFALEGGAS